MKLYDPSPRSVPQCRSFLTTVLGVLYAVITEAAPLPSPSSLPPCVAYLQTDWALPTMPLTLKLQEAGFALDFNKQVES